MSRERQKMTLRGILGLQVNINKGGGDLWHRQCALAKEPSGGQEMDLEAEDLVETRAGPGSTTP